MSATVVSGRLRRLVSIEARDFSLACGTKPECSKNREKWGSAYEHHGDASDRRDKHGRGDGVDDGLSDYHARQVRRDRAIFNSPNWRASIRRKRRRRRAGAAGSARRLSGIGAGRDADQRAGI